VNHLKVSLLTQGSAQSYTRPISLYKSSSLGELSLWCRHCIADEVLHHFSFSSMMGAVTFRVPSKNEVVAGTKGGSEQKLEQVLSS
jgi:hypothetical protein